MKTTYSIHFSLWTNLNEVVTLALGGGRHMARRVAIFVCDRFMDPERIMSSGHI